jgi:undecaprenyl-diphosphatase
MAYWKAVFLALVEGITEFIPVSSTGHLILAEEYVRLTGDSSFNADFMVVIQLPAIFAVVVYFWSRLHPFAKRPEERAAVLRLWSKIVVAFLPAVVLGLLFDDFIEAWLFNPVTVAIALAAGGVALVLLERGGRTPVIASVDDLGYGRALAVGFCQCLAMVPGVSRSAATIVGAMLLGTGRSAAAEFSFFLAIPTMLGAASLKMLKSGFVYTPEQWGLLAVGSVVSFLSAYAVVALFMGYVRRHDFKPFGWYRIVLGCVVLAWWFLAVR